HDSEEQPMQSISTIGLDIAKSVFQVRLHSVLRFSIPSMFRADVIKNKKSDDCAVIIWPSQTPDYHSSFQSARLNSDRTNNGHVKNKAQREVRSGEGATLTRNGFAVPSTGRVQQHEQMEAPRRSRTLGVPS
ncbi:hypothetical protein Q2941_50630, partial [Bradyrhizobium sp. UFLA05-153]